MALADYSREKILNHLFGNDPSWVSQSTYYIGLARGTIQNDGNNIPDVEFSGGGYERKAYSNTVSNWTNSSSGVVTNSSVVSWNQATSSWGTTTHFFIANNSTVGETSGLIVIGQLSKTKTISLYDYPAFSANSITISIT